MRRDERMQQVKIYRENMFKGNASKQFERDSRKMAKQGWHVQTVTDEAVGEKQMHVGNLKVVYEK
jgi:hypothetical protein